MKDLKRLIIVSALFGMAHGANAYEYEKDFEPVEKGDAEAQGIELVSGQLMVKSKGGRIRGVEAPYTFVGTNTANFASSGFAIKEMADANSVVLNGSDVYFTRTSDTTNVYHFAVSEKSALNGVTSQLEKIASDEPISALIAVKDGVVYGKNKSGDNVVELGDVVTPPPSITVPDSLTNTIHSVYGDKIYVANVKNGTVDRYNRYGESEGAIFVNGNWNKNKTTPRDIIALDEYNIFILDADGKLYRRTRLLGSEYTSVSGIKASKDGDSLLITSQKDEKTVVEAYDAKNDETISLYSEAITSKKPFAKSEITSNGVKYKVNGKKIGYSIAD